MAQSPHTFSLSPNNPFNIHHPPMMRILPHPTPSPLYLASSGWQTESDARVHTPAPPMHTWPAICVSSNMRMTAANELELPQQETTAQYRSGRVRASGRCNVACWEHLCEYLLGNQDEIMQRKKVRCIHEQYSCPAPCRGKQVKSINDDWAAIVKQVVAEQAHDEDAVFKNYTRQQQLIHSGAL